MLTITHHSFNAEKSVRTSFLHEALAVSRDGSKICYHRPGETVEREIDLQPTDVVYVMNDGGKTIATYHVHN